MWAGSVSHNDYTGCGRKRLFPVHKLEHELSAFRDEIAHGAGLSVLFPAWALHEMQYDVPASRSWQTECSVSRWISGIRSAPRAKAS